MAIDVTHRDPWDITKLLGQWQKGHQDALRDLLPKVYQSLRIVARRAMQTERGDHTLQPTALVHEAFLKIESAGNLVFRDRHHFFAVAATMMRRILVDHARRLLAERRGGDHFQVTLTDPSVDLPQTDLLAMNEALEQLAAVDPRKAKILEMRFFGGLSVAEIADILSVSKPTVILDTRLAKAFLYTKMNEKPRVN